MSTPPVTTEPETYVCPDGQHILYLSLRDQGNPKVNYTGCLICDLPGSSRVSTETTPQSDPQPVGTVTRNNTGELNVVRRTVDGTDTYFVHVDQTFIGFVREYAPGWAYKGIRSGDEYEGYYGSRHDAIGALLAVADLPPVHPSVPGARLFPGWFLTTDSPDGPTIWADNGTDYPQALLTRMECNATLFDGLAQVLPDRTGAQS